MFALAKDQKDPFHASEMPHTHQEGKRLGFRVYLDFVMLRSYNDTRIGRQQPIHTRDEEDGRAMAQGKSIRLQDFFS